MKTAKSLLPLVALFASAGALAAQNRLLLEDGAFRTSVAESVTCDGPIEVRLTTRDPALLDDDTADVQRVMDASVAMLRFRCPNLSRVTVRGALEDRNEDAFVAVLDRGDDWVVRTQRTFALDLSGDRRYSRDRGQGSGIAARPQLAVLGLSAGMNPESVRNILEANFNATPRLLDGGRRMVVEENGCRVDRNWMEQPHNSGVTPGWRCLQVWFTPGNNPLLYRVDYEEVVDGNRLEEATDRLIRRYGEPGLREDRTRLQGQPAGSRFSWGNEIVIDGERRRELRADIRPSPQMTVVSLSLSDRNSSQFRSFQF